MRRLPKELQTRGHVTITSTDLKTGEQRQLTDAEVAERMVKILAMDPVERVRMSFPRNTEEEATK